MWQEFKTYLFVDVKLKETPKNVSNNKSRFKTIQDYFSDKEFTRKNFNLLIEGQKNKGYSTSHLNNLIKIAKHYDKFRGFNEIQDYTYFDEVYKDKDALTFDEVQRLIKVKYPYKRLKKERLARDKIVIEFLFMTGCRIQELQNLKWENVKNWPVPNVTFMDTKTNRENRTIPITENMYKALFTLPKYGEYVFSNKSQKKFYSTEFNLMIKKRAEIAGIKKFVSCHIFRHSCATYLSDVLRYPDSFVMRYLGHKTYEAFARYKHGQLQELSVLPYAFESTSPKMLEGELIKNFVDGVINNKYKYSKLEYLENGGIRIDILSIPK